MSFSTLRECALVAGTVASVVGAWDAPAAAQQKPTPPIFSWDHTIGWVGVGEFRPPDAVQRRVRRCVACRGCHGGNV